MNTSDIKNLVNALVLGADNMGQDTIVIKSYNSWRITKEIVTESLNENANIKVLFYEFRPDKMQEAYEPFLEWIKQIYLKSGVETPEEFMEKCQVYSLHRDMLCSYIRNGVCIRKEEVILNEVEYDLKRFMDSITGILQYAASDGKLLIILGRIHFAGYSTIKYLNSVINSEESDGIALLCTYDNAYGIPEYMNDIWEEFIRTVEDKNLGIAMYSEGNAEVPDEKSYFVLEMNDYDKYIKDIHTMLKTLAIEQALYYLGSIYHKLKIEKAEVDKDSQISCFELYAFGYLYAKKFQNALMICDNLKNMGSDDLQVQFNCNYAMSMAQVYMGQNVSAMMLAKKCKALADEMQDEYMQFIARLLTGIVILKGFTAVNFQLDGVRDIISDEFMAEVESYEFYNHLSYFYIYAFEQNRECYIGEHPEKNLKYFKKGLDIIKRNENDKFLMDAYKKCALFYSVVGNIDEVDRNYKKCIDVLRRLNGKAEEADIYNGLGYNRMVREDFEQANIYYNQALEIFYKLNDPQMLSETFYNMSINALMAEDYKKCCVYITASIQLLDNYGVYKPRVCNRSKLYGIAAVCNFKLGNSYKTQIYLEKMERIFRHILIPDGEPKYDLWDDELFYYRYIKGLINKKEGMIDAALSQYDEAEFHMRRSEGSMFVSYSMLASEKADILDTLGRKEERRKLLQDCMEFSRNNENDFSATKMKTLLDGQKVKKSSFALDINIDVDAALLMAKQLGAERELLATNKNLEFLSNWQEMFVSERCYEEEMINKSMITLRNNFGLDRILFFYIKDNDEKEIKYCDSEIELSESAVDNIVRFFRERRSSFVVSRIDGEFEEYKDIIQNFGMNTVVSMIGIPMFVKDDLKTVFITYQIMYENFNGTEVMLYESDLSIFRLALRQLVNEIYRTNARIQIGEMNRELKAKNMQLENLAQTDPLTGLLNRQGFNKIVDEKLDPDNSGFNAEQYITVMYIDLDNFKYCNDSFGHDVGDMILKEFANLFTSIIGKSGYVVRYGGDEFVIVVENVNQHYGEEVAEAIFEELLENNAFADEIVESIGRHVKISDENKLSCSIGIAMDKTKNVKMISDLLKHADEALYCVKKSTKHDYKVWMKEGIE